MSDRLRAGLIGLGAMGRNHCRVLSALDGVDLVGVVDPSVTADVYGHPVVPTLEELWDLGVDYVVVACPTRLHESVGLAVADAGVHALIEKPLADSVEGAANLAKAFAGAGLTAAVGHIERFNPSLQSLRVRLAAGDLGELYQVATRRQGPFPARIDDVGVVKDLATHDIDLTAWVTGRRYLSVASRTSRRSGREHEDMVVVTAQLEDHVVANHVVNWLSPLKERSIVVTGERGCFIADTLSGDLTHYANGAIPNEWDSVRNFRGVAEGDVTRFALAKREPLVVEHEVFRDAVLTGDTAEIVTLDQALRTVEVSAAILTSASSGHTVDLLP